LHQYGNWQVLLLLLLPEVIMALGLGLGLRGGGGNGNSSSSSKNDDGGDGASAGAGTDGAVEDKRQPPSDATAYNVVFVGAGWAWVLALETLALGNVASVLLLESTSAFGGRCCSYNNDGTINRIPGGGVNDDNDV
jgi:hypothetical protein